VLGGDGLVPDDAGGGGDGGAGVLGSHGGGAGVLEVGFEVASPVGVNVAGEHDGVSGSAGGQGVEDALP